jgi:hypothetical protein
MLTTLVIHIFSVDNWGYPQKMLFACPVARSAECGFGTGNWQGQ